MTKKKILVAEDDLAILDSVTLLLQNAEYEVDGETDGLKIVARMEETLPSVLLLDVSMPGADGGDICLKLKKNKLVRHIPIILMTANNDIKKIAEKSGADDYIGKPFNINDLLQKIEKNIYFQK